MMMGERGIGLAHTTILRWVQHYTPEFEKRWQRYARPVGGSWRCDETYIKVKGNWMYLYRAVDKAGQTVDFYLSETRDREAAKLFLQRAMTNPDNPPPGVFARAVCGAIRRRFESCRPRAACGSIVGNENAHTAITGSNPITAT